MFSKFYKLFIMFTLLILSFQLIAQDIDKIADDPKSDGIGLSIETSYTSTYLWRGGYWYNQDGAFFPLMSYDLLGSGLVLSLGAELSDNWMFEKGEKTAQENRVNHATDFGVDYSYSIDKLLTIEAGVWYFMMWNYKEEVTNAFASGRVAISLDNLPVTPAIAYTHDYYKATKDKKDYYVQFGLSKSFEPIKNTGIDIGVMAGYYHVRSFGLELDGISDIDFSIDYSITADAVTYSAGFHYVYVPSEDFYMYNEEEDKNRFSASFGASYGF